MLFSTFFNRSWFGSFDDDFAILQSALTGETDRVGRLWKQAQGMTGPRCAYHDAGSEIILRAEVPGLSQADLQISAADGVLTISGKHEPSTPDGYVARHRERMPMRFSRSFALAAGAEVADAAATIEDGILTVRIPKRAEAQPRQIPVKTASY
jgi:HSP20 family protein